MPRRKRVRRNTMQRRNMCPGTEASSPHRLHTETNGTEGMVINGLVAMGEREGKEGEVLVAVVGAKRNGREGAAVSGYGTDKRERRGGERCSWWLE
ncbi:hypothetical protein LOK49_LG13G00112 [Camellia lanceoleosa]|uniref:Uncharacterized protein n=1 Tax=Camellia lanceoleosa TaxID=1840588 RepID=A0ACC0FLW3_9ERIC|nr:hypothetical protein LOK49_LG13G00112 [Camellia lanceoleosa]